jgi:phosphate-selective porin OprO/OprP
VAGGGNFQFDLAKFDSDSFEFLDEHTFRRTRVNLTAKSQSGWDLTAEYDAKFDLWTDAYARYAFDGHHSVRVGQFKQPLSLDELTSDKMTTFMEQGLPTAFGIARRAGVEYAYATPDWTATATAYGRNINVNERSDATGFAARGTWLPLHDEHGFVHLGLSMATESPDNDNARFATRPETGIATHSLVDTGMLLDVDRIDRVGLEGVGVHGPWSVQSEYLCAWVDRSGVDDFAGSGFYVNGTWSPTGHSRGYKVNTMNGPVLDGRRAWELALRYSTIDLDDGPVQGGEEADWTAAVNFYPNKYLRFSANYVVVDSERRGVADDPRILELRAQLFF